MTAISLNNVAKTATLVGSSADLVTVTAPTPAPVEVVNLSTTAVIWACAVTTATVAGDDNIPILPSTSYTFTGITTLSLISSGTPQYTVNRLG